MYLELPMVGEPVPVEDLPRVECPPLCLTGEAS